MGNSPIFRQVLSLFDDVIRSDKDFDDEEMRIECREPQAADELAQTGLVLLKNTHHVSF